MERPKMILFDYGHTLAYTAHVNYVAGAKAILSHATENPMGITSEQLQKLGEALFDEMKLALRPNNLEVEWLKAEELLYGKLGLAFDVPPPRLEYEYFRAAEPAFPMEGIGDLLNFLEQEGIRSGVISNIAYSSATLEKSTAELLPNNRFEIVIASSDYVFRKPSRHLFELAAGRAKLRPGEIWFCGDDVVCDVEGASAAGMFPVWYESPLPCFYRPVQQQPTCMHLHIKAWNELQQCLKAI